VKKGFGKTISVLLMVTLIGGVSCMYMRAGTLQCNNTGMSVVQVKGISGVCSNLAEKMNSLIELAGMDKSPFRTKDTDNSEDSGVSNKQPAIFCNNSPIAQYRSVSNNIETIDVKSPPANLRQRLL